jgi:cellulose synthase/poly-beta-1,6-N-acetylglucosamine synthase-like glycosyltransferase
MEVTNAHISIIVPVFNEEASIQELLFRLDRSMRTNEIPYEVIIVDDHSTDRTVKNVLEVEGKYPLRVITKKGKRGKAYSLLQGFAEAKAPVIAMIDADMQYPPEAIPLMFEKINGDVDIVVGKRTEQHISALRKVSSSIHSKVVGRMLHKFDVDIQSGLKVFKSEILERVVLNPGQWTFDLEFLVRARDAGYKVASYDIVFSKRRHGQSKLSLRKDALPLFLSAIKLKLSPPSVIPFSKREVEEKGKGFYYRSTEYVHHTDLPHAHSAFTQVSGPQKIFLLALVTILLTGFILNWHTTLVIFIAVLTVLYFVDLLFNFFLIYRSFSKTPEVKVSEEELRQAQGFNWPTYTVFCPLYKEWTVVSQFVDAMTNLDYPKDRLQVMLLLEEDDTETIQKVNEMRLPDNFVINVVPHSLPKTKPKAMNYGLKAASGEYVVIFDAEDIPDPLQLKKAVLAFQKVPKRVVCIQAKLNFYNPHQNIITRVFTAEYSLWFDLVLTGLQSLHAPIPLGGTSNHFKKEILEELNGWDSFNVTEDCDLGMRLVKHGYRTAVIDSITHEEANSNLKNWFNQRTRWIKGYIQSYLVHMRHPGDFIKDWREPHVITFQLIVGGKIASMFINPIMWIITISYFAFRPYVGSFIESFYPAPVLYMGLFSLLIGNFLYMYYYMIGCYKREQDEIIKYVFLVPFYWLAMSVAAWRAVYQVIVKPHYWSKTKHGFHLTNKKTMKSAEDFMKARHGDKHVPTPDNMPLSI